MTTATPTALDSLLSPLAEADPLSIDELCSRDPKTLTDPELDQIIAKLRAQRARLDLARAQGKVKASTKAKVDLSSAEL